MGTTIDAHTGTRVGSLQKKRLQQQLMTTTMQAYRPSRNARRSRSLPVKRMLNVGPDERDHTAYVGNECHSPATSAHAGASGTWSSMRPINHSTASHSAWMVAARHQLSTAFPAVRRCAVTEGRALPWRTGPDAVGAYTGGSGGRMSVGRKGRRGRRSRFAGPGERR